MLAILQALTSDQLESFRVGAIALYVIASFGVILGVFWENEDFKKETRKKAGRCYFRHSAWKRC
jgi:hypothetical protein